MTNIAQITVGLPVAGPFDYLISPSQKEKISIGSRVSVYFGPRKIIGYIVGFKEKSSFKKLKTIHALIDEKPILDESLLKLTKEISEHYGCSWGEAIEAALPAILRRGKAAPFEDFKGEDSAQKEGSRPLLIHDPTFLKRWPLLWEQIDKTLSKKKSVLILCPEITALEDVVKVIREKIQDGVLVLNKKSSSKKELEHWIQLKTGKVSIVVGLRSSIFVPLPNLGAIIVFDEDHQAYKQEQSPFYHAREVALMRSTIEGGTLIFAGATPSVEIWHLAQKKKMDFVEFEAEVKSTCQLVDMAHYYKRQFGNLSIPLKNNLEKTLSAGGRALLFLNKKGFSSSTRCRKCDYTAKCPRCDINLTYSFELKVMVCRYCQYTAAVPSVCPKCSGAYLRFSGAGIEKLESEIAPIFPGARLGHLDRDTKTLPANFQILIATQAVLKFRDKIRVDLAGVLSADSELNRPDFRSGQKAFSLLVLLRMMAQKQLFIQTRLPDDIILKSAQKLDFKKFYKNELKVRKELLLPPFSYLISLTVRALRESTASEQASVLYKEICEHNKSKKIEILEPQPDMIPKLRGRYRYFMLLKGKSAKDMLRVIHLAQKTFHRKSGVFISVNVDG